MGSAPHLERNGCEVRLVNYIDSDNQDSELTALRDQLKAGLSGTTPELGTATTPELAERIKALKAAHTITAAQERVGKRRTPAEAVDWLVRQFHAMGLKLPYPKGVYRFKTFEEANEWEWKHTIEAAVKRAILTAAGQKKYWEA